MSRKKVLWIMVALLVIAAASWGPVVSQVEQAKYSVAESHGAIEIRDYEPMIVAQARVSGARKPAISEGFRTIADFIFGNNTASQKVSMTAPVTQQTSQAIAMTAPVIQQPAENDTWEVRFVMPAEFTRETLPKPNNPDIQIIEVPAKRFVVIRFSGSSDDALLAKKKQALQSFIANKKLSAISEPTFAFFNPPWTLPILRRNEVMIEIARN